MVNRASSYANLPDYESYDLAWLGPIVYPLSFSLIAIALAWRELYRAGMARHPVNVYCAVVVGVETMFAVFCFVQCVVNYSERRYVGLEKSCDFQAWYATFWAFASLQLAPITGWLSLKAAQRSEPPAIKRVLLFTGVILLWSLFLSLLPIIGAGYYAFPKDYCMFDFTDPTMGGLFVAMFVLSGVAVIALHVKAYTVLGGLPVEPAQSMGLKEVTEYPLVTLGFLNSKRLQAVLVLWYTLVWLPTTVIVVLFTANAVEPPASSAVSATIAITLHSQQLFQPLIVAIIWRRWAVDAFGGLGTVTPLA